MVAIQSPSPPLIIYKPFPSARIMYLPSTTSTNFSLGVLVYCQRVSSCPTTYLCTSILLIVIRFTVDRHVISQSISFLSSSFFCTKFYYLYFTSSSNCVVVSIIVQITKFILLSAVILFQSTNVYLHLRNFVILQLATTTNIQIKKHNASFFFKNVNQL